MDRSISLLTTEDWQDRGAQAYLDGHGVNDHGLPEDSSARKQWQYGWHQQRIVFERAGQQLEARMPSVTFFFVPEFPGTPSPSIDSADTRAVEVAPPHTQTLSGVEP
jgi:hypothetical protein